MQKTPGGEARDRPRRTLSLLILLPCSKLHWREWRTSSGSSRWGLSVPPKGDSPIASPNICNQLYPGRNFSNPMRFVRWFRNLRP
jgi:hypothetical protein